MRTEIINLGNKWGLQERFTVYEYNNTGYCEVLVGFDGDNFCEPHIKIKGQLVPLSKRVETFMGDGKGDKTPKGVVNGYVKAKDAFYSILAEDFLLLKMRIYIAYEDLNKKNIKYPYFPRRTEYTLYTPMGYDIYTDEDTEEKKFYITWERVEQIPSELKMKMKELADKLAFQRNDKTDYIYYRTWYAGQKQGG